MDAETGIDQIAWDRLGHAYGSAADTPEHLRGLLAADLPTRASALIHLWNSVVHQETLSTAAGPVVAVLAQMLSDPRLDAPEPTPLVPVADAGPGEQSMRVGLLTYLGHIAAWAAQAQAEPNAVIGVRRDDPELASFDLIWEFADDPEHVAVGRTGSGCARRAGVVLPLLVPWLQAADSAERREALHATACWAGLAGTDTPLPPAALAALHAVARDETARLATRIDCVLGLAAGTDTSDLLTDGSAVIRACAALSPAASGNPHTLRVITETLTSATDCDDLIPDRPPVPFGANMLRIRLVQAAIRCADSFASLLPVAVSVAATASAGAVDQTWGPLLEAGFPQPRREGQPLTDAQRAYLLALAANAALWHGDWRGRDDQLRRLGLPADQASLRSLATDG
ncbi:hypothetical protein ADL15_40710 [Actinoplanes awajinensis subsp. mycoplanecinus]|uniref:Uncharacterized protein n=2 Tax=Actinoplanes awajinensis TaxID=135946 RepID=A0A101JEL5_9ACTN|nr:hypothetical protein ADL15_40710 [Actinoplanes awajinensis subsp. mycoplanecinus]